MVVVIVVVVVVLYQLEDILAALGLLGSFELGSFILGKLVVSVQIKVIIQTTILLGIPGSID